MGNTVGSYETTFWQKKWILIKTGLVVTDRQREVIIGSLLGDGTMRIGQAGRNANFKVEHGLAQRALVEWKYLELESLVFTGPKLSFRYRDMGERYPKSWWFRTIRHPVLSDIYRAFYTGEAYRTGRKRIPNDIEASLTPLALAVWIMDDGGYTRSRIDISTYSFLLKEIQLLTNSFKSRYGLRVTHYRDRDKGYRMYFNQKETAKFVQIIRPYIIPSMVYKIGFITP